MPFILRIEQVSKVWIIKHNYKFRFYPWKNA